MHPCCSAPFLPTYLTSHCCDVWLSLPHQASCTLQNGPSDTLSVLPPAPSDVCCDACLQWKQGAIKEEEEDGQGSEGGWETVSEDGDAEAAATADEEAATGPADGEEAAGEEGDWEEWDVCRCLFDNHVSDSLDANLEYMYKNFGFYLPDSEYLTDPAGLIQYLVSQHLVAGQCLAFREGKGVGSTCRIQST